MAAASARASACSRGARLRLRLVCSFLSIKVTADEAVNEDFSHLINNYQGQGQSQRQGFITAGRSDAGRSGEDGKRDSARRNVGRFTFSGTSRLRHAETGFFCAADRACFLVIPCHMTLVDTVNPLRRSPEVPPMPNRASKNNCSRFTATHEWCLKIRVHILSLQTHMSQ